ncbi:hypothetical protein HDU88_000293 [Geranomyces variabilis]|nr:hypothetical protein HDU88_000293 [Geranomyces variabilis]
MRSTYHNTNPHLTIILHDVKKSQSEQYAGLMKLFTDSGTFPQDLYVLFTNDDDLWHPLRSMAYFHVYSQLVTTGTGGTSCLFAVGQFVAGCSPVYTPEKVDELISNGTLTFDATTIPDDFGAVCCPFVVLQDFFSKAIPTLLKYPYCDVWLLKFVRKRQPNMPTRTGVGIGPTVLLSLRPCPN